MCTYIPTYLPMYLPTYVPTYLPTYVHTYLPTYVNTYIHIYINTYVEFAFRCGGKLEFFVANFPKLKTCNAKYKRNEVGKINL
jgi:hypothetical protein